jgi:antitoxin VapB
MGVIQTKAFKSGNSVAVRLPKELGIEAGTPLTIEPNGKGVIIQPAVDPDEEKRKLSELVARIREIWADCEDRPISKREPIEFPERPGL